MVSVPRGVPSGVKKAKRGFAAMTPEMRRALQSKGGRSVPAGKRAYSVDRELASRSGLKAGRGGTGGGA